MAVLMAMLYTVTLSISNVSVGLITERWLPNDDQAEIKAG